jgi:hypothetical protein
MQMGILHHEGHEETRDHPQIAQISQIETERNLRKSAKSVDPFF